MLKGIKARLSRESTDDTRAKEREAKRVAKALAAQTGKEHYKNASGKGHDPHPG
jgi:hypothetical protein